MKRIARRYFGRDRLFDELGECPVCRPDQLAVAKLMAEICVRTLKRDIHAKRSGR